MEACMSDLPVPLTSEASDLTAISRSACRFFAWGAEMYQWHNYCAGDVGIWHRMQD